MEMLDYNVVEFLELFLNTLSLITLYFDVSVLDGTACATMLLEQSGKVVHGIGIVHKSGDHRDRLSLATLRVEPDSYLLSFAIVLEHGEHLG
jgi:hypothetical protein